MKLLVLLALSGTVLSAGGPFRFHENSPHSLELKEGGQPVFVYNHGMILKEGMKEEYRRSSYLHPLYAPDGTVLTDDFPQDHPHHRGVCWTWPVVHFEGQTHDVWALLGMHQRFRRWLVREASGDRAWLAVENGWFTGGRQAAKEVVEFLVHPAAGGRRTIDFTLTLEALGPAVEIAGREKKGYGGLGIRFAPREATAIRTDAGLESGDSDLVVHPWAELSARFQGRAAGARIEIDPANPGAPNGWCLRHYGYIAVNWPGLESFRLERGKPFTLRYRITVFSGPSAASPAH